jgi:hypothetical protein
VTYRNRKLLDLAHRVNYCTLRIPGVCSVYSAEGCEPAHSNSQAHGKGTGLKASDIYHAAACPACHREIDSGRQLSREEKREYWRQGFERTMALYFENNWVCVK